MSNKYPAIIYPCDEGGFVAEVPMLSGCLAQGETMHECLQELETVVMIWLETVQIQNRSIPSCEIVMQKLRTL
jgi:antitoxin HicB